MRIHPFDLAPVLPEDVVFRRSRLSSLLGLVILAGMMAGAVILWINRSVPPVIGWIALAVTALIMLPLWWHLLGAFSTTNWILRLYGQRILLKIGPVNGHDPSRVFVAEFQSKEIEWARSFKRTTTTRRADGGTVTSSTTWLELKLRDGNIEELQSCLRTAGAPRRWRNVTSSVTLPVSLTGEGVLRLEWRSPYIAVAPSIRRVLDLLGKNIRLEPKETERNDLSSSNTDKKEMERQILELTERGQVLEATKLARQCYGYSLAEAQQFVAGLTEGNHTALPGDSSAKKSLEP